jgi:hypothetical protein
MEFAACACAAAIAPTAVAAAETRKRRRSNIDFLPLFSLSRVIAGMS